MSRTFTAKYPGTCCGCNTDIRPGNSVRYAGRRSLFHSGCVPSGPRGTVSRDDQQYYQGIHEAETVKMVRAVYGEAAAIEEELRQDARAGDY